MGLFRKAVIVVLVGIAIKFFFFRETPPPPVFGGQVQSGFESVEKAFRQNFEEGFEPDGAAYAVCHRGKIVVDLWGGYSDKASLRPWKQDTMTTVFSTTKGVAALVVAVLVDRGLLNYDDLVIKYWPEFGKHGKANVTVKWLVSHQAGLAALDGKVTLEAVRNWRLMSKLFEDQVPNWPPGTDAGYHALTHGWLCDQLVRRVDPQHRSLGKYFQDEIAKPFGIDFYIGLPRDQLYRVSRMTVATFWDLVKRLDDWPYVEFLAKFTFRRQNPFMAKIMNNPDWLISDNTYFKFNNPDLHEIEMPAANGMGTARALARLYCLLDGTELVSKTTLNKISQPIIVGQEDRVVGLNISWGWGFMHTLNNQGQWQIGHPGYGGQNAKYDPQERVAIAYIRNNMAPDMGEMTRTFRNLQHATFESIRAQKSKS